MKKFFSSGSALIEFVLVMPLLLIFICGVIEFGAMFYDLAIITNAAKEGARYGIIHKSPYATSAQINTFVQSYCGKFLITFGKTKTITVTVTTSATPPVFGSTVTVKVSYTYGGLVLYKMIKTSQNDVLTATSTMTYE